VFNFLRFYFDFELENFAQLSEEQAFQSIFDDLTEENWEEKLSKGDDAGDYAYSLNIVNPEKKTFYSRGVEYFGLNNFDNIPLPYSQSETFGDKIDNFFLEYENKDESSDDDMDYGTSTKKEAKPKSTTVKNGTNDGYYDEIEFRGGPKRKVFELEVFWNKDRKQAAIHKLDRCKKHENYNEIAEKADKVNSEAITLRQCFESFMTPEMLGQDNAWYCRVCKDHVEAMKKMELYSSPPVLLISLKRFKSGRGSYFKDKLEEKVFFPFDLDISDIVLSNKNEDGSLKGTVEYELYAVSNHYGNMGFGHYTAYGKNPKEDAWYDFDDSNVTEVKDLNSVVSEAAYNLFYKRKDFSFTEEVDYSQLKQTCDFEEFKLEVAHYAKPEEKKEESKASGDAEMAD
jgi:hypothetical protein